MVRKDFDTIDCGSGSRRKSALTVYYQTECSGDVAEHCLSAQACWFIGLPSQSIDCFPHKNDRDDFLSSNTGKTPP
jgi:hypothetical protein